jgi:hypothetical protein
MSHSVLFVFYISEFTLVTGTTCIIMLWSGALPPTNDVTLVLLHSFPSSFSTISGENQTVFLRIYLQYTSND